MSSVKNNIVRFSGCCIALAVGLLSDKLAGPIAIAGLGEMIEAVAGNVLSEKLGLFASGIPGNFRRKHPSELNHDLQKLLLSAIQVALKNIEVLYSEKNIDKEDITNVKVFTREIINNLPIYFNATTDDDEGNKQINRLLDTNNDSNEILFQFMQLEMANYQLSFSYRSFLEDNISIQLQLCIAEKFKDEKHRKGWIAFQRLMFQDIKDNIDLVLKGQESLQRDIQDLKSSKINNPIILDISDQKVIERVLKGLTFENISISFNKSLRDILKDFERQQEILLENIIENRKISEKNYHVSLETREYAIENREGLRVLDKTVEKKLTGKKVALLTTISIVLLFLTIWIHNYYTSIPFAATLELKIKDSKTNLALKNKIIAQIFLEEEVLESEVINNEVKLLSIPGKYRNKPVKIILKNIQYEPYKLYCDSCLVTLNPNKLIPVELITTNLDVVKGFVLSENGHTISGATVIVNNIESKTDSNGAFSISLPLEKQKPFQDISVYKEGYEQANEKGIAVYLIPQQKDGIKIILKK